MSKAKQFKVTSDTGYALGCLFTLILIVIGFIGVLLAGVLVAIFG